MGKGKWKGGFTGVSNFIFSMDQQYSTSGTVTQGEEMGIREQPPVKKRKTDDNAEWIEKYDATGLVPHYTQADQVPQHLQKYFSQRHRYFSLYSKSPGCLLDEEGWFSVTPERVADQIAQRCCCDTILDPFCGVGGNAIAFAKTCQRVIALDISPTRLALARHNAQIYGVADRIEFVLSDFLSFVKAYDNLSSIYRHNQSTSPSARKIDVVFLSPPWGGPSYIDDSSEEQADEHPSFSLSSIRPLHGAELFHMARKVTKNVAFYLPRNTKIEEIGALVSDDVSRKENVEIEEEWMGNKLKALTCYFGGLVQGQEDAF